MALTPCCSAVELLPEAIAPASEIDAAVIFKPGSQTGRVKLSFVIQTDQRERPIQKLAIFADLLADWEVGVRGSVPLALRVGERGRRAFVVKSRRQGDAGLGLPTSVRASEPIRAEFRGEGTETQRSGGVIEAVREVELSIPPMPEPGAHSAELRFGWADGTSHSHTVRWTIEPKIRVAPSSLIVKRSEGRVERTVVVDSDDRPFRVTGISVPFLGASVLPSLDSRRVHRVEFAIDPSQSPQAAAGDVVLTTDHPDQPRVRVTLLVVPESGDRP